jgi:hypothetical protein
VLIGAFLVNLLSSSIFDLLISLTSVVGMERLILGSVFTVGSLFSLIVVFFFFKRQLRKYQPQTPILTLIVKPDDIKPFLNKQRYGDIAKFLDDGKLTNFKLFANSVFENLRNNFIFLFGHEIKEPIKEYEEEATIPRDEEHKGLVTMAKDYDLSKISPTGVKTTLQIKLTPDVTYSFSDEGDKTASYSFYLSFYFIVLNPEHCDASKLIEAYYLYRARELVKFASYAINWAFGAVGLEFDYLKKKTV